jgi:hypothetical protein
MFTESFTTNQAIDDRLRKLELVASQICSERSIRMEHSRSSLPGERLANLEQRLAALLETETETEEEMPRHQTLTETHARDATSALNEDGLSADDLKTQRALGLTTTQIQKAKLRSLRAENARLESSR